MGGEITLFPPPIYNLYRNKKINFVFVFSVFINVIRVFSSGCMSIYIVRCRKERARDKVRDRKADITTACALI